VAQVLYARREVVSKEDFPFVYWEGYGACYEIVPGDVLCLGNKTCLTFSRDQLTAVTHRKLVLNVCPSCNCHDKSTSHITWCPNPGRARTLKDLVEQLVQWLYDQQTDGKVVHVFQQYLLAGAGGTGTLICY
jgi:hypothetical protein